MFQSIDFPEQHLPMLPSISQSSLIVNASACRSQTAACPLPLPEMWTASNAYLYTEGLSTQSDLIDAAAWDPEYASLLGLDGSGRHIRQRMTLHHGDSTNLDSNAMSVSENYSVRYSSEAGYTMDVGFVSVPRMICLEREVFRLTMPSSRYMALRTRCSMRPPMGLPSAQALRYLKLTRGVRCPQVLTVYT